MLADRDVDLFRCDRDGARKERARKGTQEHIGNNVPVELEVEDLNHGPQLQMAGSNGFLILGVACLAGLVGLRRV